MDWLISTTSLAKLGEAAMHGSWSVPPKDCYKILLLSALATANWPGTLRRSALAAMIFMRCSEPSLLHDRQIGGAFELAAIILCCRNHVRVRFERAQPHELSRSRARAQAAKPLLAPPRALMNLAPLHSISSSARARKVGGTVKGPTAFAALKVMTRSTSWSALCGIRGKAASDFDGMRPPNLIESGQ